MTRVHTYRIAPCLPARLQCLQKLSLNLRWSWRHPTIELFRALDPDPWEATGHNPRLILGRIDQARLSELRGDEAFLAVGSGIGRSGRIPCRYQSGSPGRTRMQQGSGLPISPRSSD